MRQRAFEFFSGPFGLGSELITTAGDRTFAAGQGNWTVEAGDDVAWAGGDCDWACDEANTIQLPVTLTDGTVYRVGVEITAYTSGDIKVYLGAANIDIDTEAVASFIVYLAAGAGDFIEFRSSDFIGSIDNISIKRVL